MASLFTPPSSDHGEYNDSIMMDADHYFSTTYYPSPAPSMIPSYTAPSPDMCMSDSIYDTEEELQQTLDSHPAAYTSTFGVASEDHVMISTMMPCPSFDPMAWPPSHSYAALPSSHSYPSESTAFEPLVTQASNAMIPPMPETVTSATSNGYGPVEQGLGLSLSVYHAPDNRRFSMSAISSRAASPSPATFHSDLSSTPRSAGLSHRSPSSPLHACGVPVHSPESMDGIAWRCAFPSCTSRAVFTRGCDLRKHYNRHSKHLFCRHAGCSQSKEACIAAAQQAARGGGGGGGSSSSSSSRTRSVSRQNSSRSGGRLRSTSEFLLSGGFSSKKDLARHEAKHNPEIQCEWHGPNGEQCVRMFSRMDNMKDHVRRIHNKGQPLPSSMSPRARTRAGVEAGGRARHERA